MNKAIAILSAGAETFANATSLLRFGRSCLPVLAALALGGIAGWLGGVVRGAWAFVGCVEWVFASVTPRVASSAAAK